MSLDWSIKDVVDWEELHKIEGEERITEVIIWGCLLVDIGEITVANYIQWHDRYFFLNRVNGPFSHKNVDGEMVSWIPSLEDVKRRIGLHTNVGPNTTDAQFLKKTFKVFIDRRNKQRKRERYRDSDSKGTTDSFNSREENEDEVAED
jgi:hypothetical protein